MSYTSREAIKYTTEVYVKNRKLLEKGFVPETNNTMEQLFSIINDFAVQIPQYSQWLNKLDKQFADELQVIQHRIEVFLFYRSLFMDNS